MPIDAFLLHYLTSSDILGGIISSYTRLKVGRNAKFGEIPISPLWTLLSLHYLTGAYRCVPTTLHHLIILSSAIVRGYLISYKGLKVKYETKMAPISCSAS